MWHIKTFTTEAAMRAFVARNEARMQWHEIAINNGYGIEYRPLRIIG